MVDAHHGGADHLKVVWESEQARQFGNVVRELRRQAGMSQEALAHQVGITKNHIQLVEAGRGSSRADGPPSNPRLTTVYALARALGVRPQELLPE